MRKYLFPYELIELNWRFWSFLVIIAVGIFAVTSFPVAETSGYIDPFYSPTVAILPLPGLFRLTCYAYRKDYHRHLFNHPLGCANTSRGEAHKQLYTGERNAFFQLENYHRYFLYAGLAILPFFYYDVYHSLAYQGDLRLGTLVLHLIGGNVDCYSCAYGGNARRSIWGIQSWWNKHHEALAWVSLLTIIFADLYLRALQAGLPVDSRII